MNRVIIFFSLLFVISCKNDETNDNSEEKNKDNKIENNGVSVTTFVIESQNFQKQIIANGKIEALKKSELRFKTSDRLASVNVKNGDKVYKGQVLATLDHGLIVNQLNKAKLEVEKAKNKLHEEKINFGIGNSNNETIAPAILKNLQIKSGYLEAENALENAQLLYNQTILRAPFNGVIANIETKTGNYITASDPFCSVIAQQNLEVAFFVLENEMPFVTKNQAVDIVSFVDSDKTYQGRITEINPLVDENGLIQVKAKINSPGASLFDGMHAKVVINQALQNVIVVPKEALVLRSNKEVVFTVEEGLAKWNYVEKFEENSTSYAIKKGLKLGDAVIVSGNMNLSHDAKVKVNSQN